MSRFDLERAYMLMSEPQRVGGIVCLTHSPDPRIFEDIPTISIDRRLGPGVAGNDHGGGYRSEDQEYDCSGILLLHNPTSLWNRWRGGARTSRFNQAPKAYPVCSCSPSLMAAAEHMGLKRSPPPRHGGLPAHPIY